MNLSTAGKSTRSFGSTLRKYFNCLPNRGGGGSYPDQTISCFFPSKIKPSQIDLNNLKYEIKQTYSFSNCDQSCHQSQISVLFHNCWINASPPYPNVDQFILKECEIFT